MNIDYWSNKMTEHLQFWRVPVLRHGEKHIKDKWKHDRIRGAQEPGSLTRSIYLVLILYIMPYRTQLWKGTTCTYIQELLIPMLILIGSGFRKDFWMKSSWQTDGPADAKSWQKLPLAIGSSSLLYMYMVILTINVTSVQVQLKHKEKQK